MTYTVEKTIPGPEEVLKKLPLTEQLRKQVERDRQELIDILEGRDNRKIVIIGPCSAWPKQAVIQYASRLKEIEAKVKDRIKIVLRVYTQKPRTTVGWKGALNQPDPYADPDIEQGIMYCRKMMLDALQAGLPLADEAVFTHNEGYFTDLLSWIAIGARSGEDQEHRIFASMIDHPVGVKNPTSGNIAVGVNSVIAAQHPHVFVLNGKQIRTDGNPHAHLVLRGGKGKPNATPRKIRKAISLMEEKNIKNPSVIIDVSHENSIDPETGKKDPLKQPAVVKDILDLIQEDPQASEGVKGFMIESFLKTGKQDMKKATKTEDLDMGGLSITDACVGIDETERMLLDLHERL